MSNEWGAKHKVWVLPLVAHCSLLIAHYSLPVKSLLLPDIDVAHAEEKDEEEHLAEDEPGEAVGSAGRAAVDDRPGIEKRGLDVEQDEQHRDLIEADVDAFPALIEKRHAALVRRELGRIPLMSSQEPVQAQEERTHARRDDEHDQDGDVAVRHKKAGEY